MGDRAGKDAQASWFRLAVFSRP